MTPALHTRLRSVLSAISDALESDGESGSTDRADLARELREILESYDKSRDPSSGVALPTVPTPDCIDAYGFRTTFSRDAVIGYGRACVQSVTGPSATERLGWVRLKAIETMRSDADVSGIMVHQGEPLDSIPVYIATRGDT